MGLDACRCFLLLDDCCLFPSSVRMVSTHKTRRRLGESIYPTYYHTTPLLVTLLSRFAPCSDRSLRRANCISPRHRPRAAETSLCVLPPSSSPHTVASTALPPAWSPSGSCGTLNGPGTLN